jgi:cell division protein FtsA
MGQSTAILDIGSSKIICLICGTDGRGGILVQGAGIKEYPGYKRGAFEDEQQLADAVLDALSVAETEARHRVRDISVGVPAPFTKLIMQRGEVDFRGKQRRITHRDIDNVINASLDFDAPDGYSLIHSTPVEFTVQDAVRSDMPIGVMAAGFGATVSHLYVEDHFKQLISDALLRVGLDADMYIAVPLSEGVFVIPEKERGDRAVLIDSGFTHTDVCVVKNAALVDMRTIPVGGMHFTSDLGYGIGIKETVAENVKRRYVYSLDYQDSIDTIRVPGGGTMYVEHEAIQYIIEERTRELCRLIKEAFKEMGVEITPTLPVYMSGGGVTLMRGCCEFMEKELGTAVQVRMPWMPRLSSPNYASAFSVMDFVMHASDEDNAGRLEGAGTNKNVLKKLIDLFK